MPPARGGRSSTGKLLAAIVVQTYDQCEAACRRTAACTGYAFTSGTKPADPAAKAPANCNLLGGALGSTAANNVVSCRMPCDHSAMAVKRANALQRAPLPPPPLPPPGPAPKQGSLAPNSGPTPAPWVVTQRPIAPAPMAKQAAGSTVRAQWLDNLVDAEPARRCSFRQAHAAQPKHLRGIRCVGATLGLIRASRR